MTPSADTDESEVLSLRRNLKEEYLTYEAKIITTFSVVDNMKKQFYAQHRKISSLPMAYPFSDFKYSSDGLTIVGISFCTTIVCEAISWVFIYRTNSYKILH
ncbi:hypothetical protein GLYMA_07G000600v4 [Glycine max]|nr:hypothetical protein GLYMA_07G000600v4 [Glycine max]KAH1084575.1 hypothetical protein GYH30_016936 [Glycine max]